jgi:hypothetical protein
MTANGPQTLRDEYSQATNIPDVEEQHQLKILLQKYEHLFDGTLGEFNMEQSSISLQLMVCNGKPVHASCATIHCS